MDLLTEMTIHANQVSLTFAGNRIITGTYISPGTDLPTPHDSPMEDGEIRMGDYNVPHPHRTGDPETTTSVRGVTLHQ